MPDFDSDYRAARVRRRQWQVLTGTFLITLAIGLLFVWLRPPIYQSLSILHFSYPKPLAGELNSVAEEQINVHAQRLVSNRVLQGIQSGLQSSKGIAVGIEDLSDMLRAEPVAVSRLIKLSATGTEKGLLLPVMSAWIETYLQSRNSEQASSDSDAMAAVEDKIAALDQRLESKRQQLTAFSKESRIVSLERDENRILNNIQGLARSLDLAVEEQATTAATLQSLRTALNRGEVSVRPQDQASIDRLENVVFEIETQLRDLGLQYTEQYMALDPKIVALRRSADRARQTWTDRRKESQLAYLHDAEQALTTANGKVSDLQQQMRDLEEKARSFNSKLVEYRALDQELADLELQAQELKKQRVELEVQRPYEASIDILEQPFAPDFAIGPPYWRNSGIALLVSLLASLLALVVYSAIQGGKRSALVIAAPFSVNSPLPNQTLAQDPVRAGLSQNHTPSLEAPPAVVLQEDDIRGLYRHANADGRCLITLLMSGVAIAELERLERSAFLPVENDRGNTDKAGMELAVGGRFSRRLPLLPGLAASLAQHLAHLPEKASIWQQPSGEELSRSDLALLLQQAALDAGLAQPDSFTLENLRLSYLAHLVDQGCPVNQLERWAGQVTPAEMVRLRNRVETGAGQTMPSEAGQVIETRYPLPDEAVD